MRTGSRPKTSGSDLSGFASLRAARPIPSAVNTPVGFGVNGMLALALIKSGRQYWPWLREQVANNPPIAFIVGHGKPAEGAELGAALLKQIDARL